jgi:hypothetical protein
MLKHPLRLRRGSARSAGVRCSLAGLHLSPRPSHRKRGEGDGRAVRLTGGSADAAL